MCRRETRLHGFLDSAFLVPRLRQPSPDVSGHQAILVLYFLKWSIETICLFERTELLPYY